MTDKPKMVTNSDAMRAFVESRALESSASPAAPNVDADTRSPDAPLPAYYVPKGASRAKE